MNNTHDAIEPLPPARGSAHREGAMESALARSVIGALKSCIAAHGPITKDWVGSAAKRVVRELEGKGFVTK